MSTDLFCWNVRGLNKFSHRSGLRKWFRKNSPLFGGILETHVKLPKKNKFISEIFPGWLSDDNYGFSPSGKIFLVWHPSLMVSVVSKSLQMITVEVIRPSNNTSSFISVIYAANTVDERVLLWAEINALALLHNLGSKPWLVIGDFNQIRDPSEHSKQPTLNMDKKIRDFNNCLLDANLEDLNFRGTTFTWWNKRKLAPLAKKLDRALVNDEWYYAFPSSVAFFGPPEYSDHAVVTISLEPAKQRLKKPFRFYNFTIQNQDFLAVVCTSWFSCNITGSAMFRVSRKLKLLKNAIRELSKQNYSGIEKKTAHAHEKMLQAQTVMLSSPSVPNASAKIQAVHEWEELSTAEAAFYFQRSRVNWISLGDGSTRLFHRYAASRQALNHIHFLISDSGERIDSQVGIQEQCVEYFSSLLGSPVSQPMFIQSDLNLLFDFKCSEAQAAGFEKPFTAEDVRNALCSLPKNKTAGPDGYSAEFFIATWSVIGPEVTEAILEFFKSGRLLKQWNSASLVLIPKITNASLTTDFRPISCLNTLSKVISKLLASRLQEILPLMVSKAQSAFLPVRLLAENVLLATDLVKGYNTQALSPRGMLKADLRKAFDCVRWDFILSSLRALAIPESYISLISECLSTSSFSVTVNGASGGFFKSTKGIRQGDPLSPYLFVLAMEALSRLLLSRYEAGNIGYHPGTAPLKISHLMFADDVMVFFDGTSNSLHGIAKCLDDFASWSGLHMNKSKTELFTSGVDQRESNAITGYGFASGKLPIRYLGLPLMSRKMKISEYSSLIVKLTKSFQGWSVKLLSFAGRLQLLKTVIFGTVNFWTSAFILPKGCIKEIESLCSRFLWSGNIEKEV